MADKAHRQTDRTIDEMERDIDEIYREAEKDMRAKWDKYMADIAKELEGLEKEYQAAKDAGNTEEAKKIGRTIGKAKKERTIMDKYYQDMVAELAAGYTNARRTAADYVNGRLPDVYALNYNAIGKGIESKVNGYSFNLVDRQTVMDLMTIDDDLLPRLDVDNAKSNQWNRKVINSQVLQGILQGESMDKIADRLQSVTETTAASAMRNARTATTAAENRGRLDANSSAEADGVILEKEWLATSDDRTRDSHAAANGQKVPNDEAFEVGGSALMYPGDPDGAPEEVYNCRCTMVTNVVGFRPLRSAEENEPMPAAENAATAGLSHRR